MDSLKPGHGRNVRCLQTNHPQVITSPRIGLIEIVDPRTGETLPPETPGEIVYTPLDARGSIVLRTALVILRGD